MSTVEKIERAALSATREATQTGQSGVADSARRAAWRVLAALFRRIGPVSDGIALGFEHGFDSGHMLDYVYENRARGRWLIGRLVDRIYLDAIGWRAIRARKELLKDAIGALLAERDRQQVPTMILDVAAGPGRYLQEVCRRWRVDGRQGALTVICRDLDHDGLARGRREAVAWGLTNVRYEPGDACDPASLATVDPRPDIAIASGLYELLEPALVRRSMAAIHDVLPRGGCFVFTTQVHHPQLELIANLLVNRYREPWVMECRPLGLTEEWAREAGFVVVESRLEEVGLFGVTVCVKPGDAARRGPTGSS